jgi:hypothetical protein
VEAAFCRNDRTAHEEGWVEEAHNRGGDNPEGVLPHRGNTRDANRNDALVVVGVEDLSCDIHHNHGGEVGQQDNHGNLLVVILAS